MSLKRLDIKSYVIDVTPIQNKKSNFWWKQWYFWYYFLQCNIRKYHKFRNKITVMIWWTNKGTIKRKGYDHQKSASREWAFKKKSLENFGEQNYFSWNQPKRAWAVQQKCQNLITKTHTVNGMVHLISNNIKRGKPVKVLLMQTLPNCRIWSKQYWGRGCKWVGWWILSVKLLRIWSIIMFVCFLLIQSKTSAFPRSIFSMFFVIWKQFLMLTDKILFQSFLKITFFLCVWF